MIFRNCVYCDYHILVMTACNDSMLAFERTKFLCARLGIEMKPCRSDTYVRKS